MCVSVQKELALSQGLLYSNSTPVLTDGVCGSVYRQTALMEERECVCVACVKRGHNEERTRQGNVQQQTHRQESY